MILMVMIIIYNIKNHHQENTVSLLNALKSCGVKLRGFYNNSTKRNIELVLNWVFRARNSIDIKNKQAHFFNVNVLANKCNICLSAYMV